MKSIFIVVGFALLSFLLATDGILGKSTGEKPKLTPGQQLPDESKLSPLAFSDRNQRLGIIRKKLRNEAAAEAAEYDASPSLKNLGIVNSLNKDLFNVYHKTAYLAKPLIVHMDVLLIKVKSTVEKEGIFESVVALFIEWHDERLQWDPLEYGNVTHLSIDPDQVGLPDIAMTNSADHLYAITRDSHFNVRVSYDGVLKYVPTGTARTWCDMKLMTFPFDIQKCSLEFESWSLDKTVMTFDGTSSLRLDTSFVSQLWTICHWKAITYDHTYFTNETFTRVRFDIKVKRKSTFYIINLIFPCSTLSLIQTLVFAISSQETTADRIGFGTTNLLTLVVFQTVVTEEMPKTSDAVTALSKYVIALIITSALGIFESVLVERMLTTHQKPPPMLLLRILRPVPILFREIPEQDDCEYDFMKEQEAAGVSGLASCLAKAMSVYTLPSSASSMFRSRANTVSTTAPSTTICKQNSSHDPWLPQQLEAGSLLFQQSQTDIANPLASPTLFNKGSNSDRRRKTYSSDKLADSANGLTRSESKPSIVLSKSGSKASLCTMQINGDNNKDSKDNNNNDEQAGLPAPRHIPAGQRSRNRRLWKELAFKVDSVTFVICAALGVIIPILLFLPLIYLDTRCEALAD